MKHPTTPSPDRFPSTVITPSRDAEGGVPYDVPVSPPRFDAIREVFFRVFCPASADDKTRLVTEPG